MARFIKSFNNDAAIQEAVDNKTLGKPYVALDDATGKIDWDSKFIDYSKMYLTVEALEDGDFYVKAPGRYTRSLFSKNGAEWENIQDYSATTISVKMGDVLRFKGNPYTPSDKLIFSGNTIDFVAYGNPQSLHYLDSFVDISNYRELSNIFKDCSGLVDASNVVIPSNSVSCSNMFQGCTSLTAAPELPATTLADGCYSNMFFGCTSLTSAPELPATTLAANCYSNMFFGCTSLTAAPSIINATSIPDQSCRSMFQGCTSLTTAPALPATTLGVLSYGSMFSGCTSLTTAPELPESSVVDAFTQGSYQTMFAGCSNIIRIKCLATSVGEYSFNNWVNGVSTTGTFVKKAGVTWPTGNSGIPSGWTVIEE